MIEAVEKFYCMRLDGRDTPPRCDEFTKKSGSGVKNIWLRGIASICGRFYAMDRDNRWDRIKPAYELLTESKSEFSFKDADTALNAAYERGEDDEFVKPTLVGAGEYPPISDNDVVIFMNFRADRARQLTEFLLMKTSSNLNALESRSCLNSSC